MKNTRRIDFNTLLLCIRAYFRTPHAHPVGALPSRAAIDNGKIKEIFSNLEEEELRQKKKKQIFD